MPITDHMIAAGDYQQQGILVSELNPQPTDLSAEELQARFDALGLLIKDKHNALIADLVNAFTAAGITNAVLVADSTKAASTTVAGQLAYLLWYINSINQTVQHQVIGDGTVTDAQLSNNTTEIKQRYATHTTGTSAQHTIAQLPTGTTAITVALGNHTHSYAEATHTHDDRYYTETETTSLLNAKAASTHLHAAGDVTSGTFAFDRLPTGTTSTTVSKGDHKHAAGDVTSGTIADACIPALAISKISGLQGALDGKAAVSHNHGSYYVRSDRDQDTGMYWDGNQMVVRINSSAWGIAFNGHTHGLTDSGIHYSTGDPGQVPGRVWLKPIT